MSTPLVLARGLSQYKRNFTRLPVCLRAGDRGHTLASHVVISQFKCALYSPFRLPPSFGLLVSHYFGLLGDDVPFGGISFICLRPLRRGRQLFILILHTLQSLLTMRSLSFCPPLPPSTEITLFTWSARSFREHRCTLT